MSDIEVSYKGNTIGTLDASGTLTLETAGKYCEDDIELEYVKPSGGSDITQLSIVENAGYLNSDGSIHSASTNQEKYTDPIPCSEGDIFLFAWSNTTSVQLWAAYATYDSNGDIIARPQIVNSAQADYTYVYKATAGVSSVVFTYRTFGTAERAVYSLVFPD